MQENERRHFDEKFAESLGKLEKGQESAMEFFRFHVNQSDKRYEKLVAECSVCREGLDTRVETIETLIIELRRPVKGVFVAIGIIITAALGGLGVSVWDWFKVHFHP
jgi:hypothetical protein